MSFGNHQYQHRYFRNQPYKKYIHQSNQSHALNSSLIHPTQQYYSPQIKQQPQPLTNQLNIRVRAPQNNRFQLGTQGSRIKQHIIDKYSQNYIYNREMLEKFKRDSEEYRKRKRFGSKYKEDTSFQLPAVNRGYNQAEQNFMYENRNRRMQTQPQLRVQPQKVYFEHQRSDTQEQEIRKYNVGVMARIENSPNFQGQYQIIKRKQTQTQKQNIKLRQYKKKYKKLKNKLQEQMHKKLNEYEIKRKSQENINQQRQRLQNIEHLINDISGKLQKNTMFINQSIKIHDNYSRIVKEPIAKEQQINQSFIYQYEDNHHEQSPNKHSAISYNTQPRYVQQWSENKSKPSPKVVYQQKSLKDKYKESQELEREINRYNKLLRNKAM